MVSSADKCPKCGGAVVCSYGVKSCINCGETPMTDEERKRWWRANKKEIAKDTREIGVPATIKKWRISHHLIPHLYRGKHPELTKAAPAANSPPPRAELPPLPEFKDSWPEAVQLRWFDIWIYFSLRE